MAEDIQNEGSEEEKKDDSQQDEDFGLPDLEFEELEELDLNIDEVGAEESGSDSSDQSGSEVLTGADDIDMSALDDIEVPEETEPSAAIDEKGAEAASALDEGIDEIEDVLDSAQLISDRLGDEEEDEIETSVPDAIDSSSVESETDLSSIEESAPIEDSVTESFEPGSVESVTGLTDEELEALMTPPEPVADIESILGDTPTDVDDILASIDSSSEDASTGVSEEAPPEVDTEDTVGSSLFAADDQPSVEASKSEDTTEETVSPEEGGNSVFESDTGGQESPESSTGSIFESDAGGSSIFESDSIALDAPSSEKVEFQSPEKASLPPNYKPYTYEEATTGNFAKVIVIGVVTIGLIGAALLYFYWQSPEGKDEGKQVAKTEKIKKTPAKKEEKPAASKEEEKPAETGTAKTEQPVNQASAKKVVEEEKIPAEKPVRKTVTKAPVQTASSGEIVPIKEKTGRVYAIIGSFIDEDLAMDYASELSAQGKGVKIIYPYGNSRNYRVTIADFASYSDATANMDNIKADYGDQVWALKY